MKKERMRIRILYLQGEPQFAIVADRRICIFEGIILANEFSGGKQYHFMSFAGRIPSVVQVESILDGFGVRVILEDISRRLKVESMIVALLEGVFAEHAPVVYHGTSLLIMDRTTFLNPEGCMAW